jgi:hypothetical protein
MAVEKGWVFCTITEGDREARPQPWRNVLTSEDLDVVRQGAARFALGRLLTPEELEQVHASLELGYPRGVNPVLGLDLKGPKVRGLLTETYGRADGRQAMIEPDSKPGIVTLSYISNVEKSPEQAA